MIKARTVLSCCMDWMASSKEPISDLDIALSCFCLFMPMTTMPSWGFERMNSGLAELWARQAWRKSREIIFSYS